MHHLGRLIEYRQWICLSENHIDCCQKFCFQYRIVVSVLQGFSQTLCLTGLTAIGRKFFGFECILSGFGIGQMCEVPNS